MTNNPDKIKSIENSGIVLNSRIPLEIDSNEMNESYPAKKKKYFGHLLEKIQYCIRRIMSFYDPFKFRCHGKNFAYRCYL